MTFKEWKLWISSMPWALKWFAILVLIRPVVDNFYYLKNVSPLLSPLYLVGIATPILCIAGILNYRKKDQGAGDILFAAWSVIIFISLIFTLFPAGASKLFFEYLLKLSMPVYLYFFLRLFIRSRSDLDGILQTFLYSSIFVGGIFLFEVVVNPIKVLKTRELTRIQGSYGDVMNYAIYLTQAFLITCYFYFRGKKTVSQAKRLRNVIIVGVLAVMILFRISHTSSYAVFSILLLLFVLFNMKTNKSAGFAIIIALSSIFYIFGQDVVEKNISPLLKTDMEVFEGKKSNERLLHGRVGRWKGMLEEFSQFPVSAQLFGMPLTLESCYPEIGTGSHNDFVRILFFTGIIGLILYIALLIVIFSKIRFLKDDTHFLVLGGLVILVFYSVSTCPTLYAPMLYIIISIMCYLSLPEKALRNGQ